MMRAWVGPTPSPSFCYPCLVGGGGRGGKTPTTVGPPPGTEYSPSFLSDLRAKVLPLKGRVVTGALHTTQAP